MDDLISDIRRYLSFMYHHPGKNITTTEVSTFSDMHRYIYDNLANRDSGLKMSPYQGDVALLSVTQLRGESNLESNISSTIKDRRALPKKWEKLLRDNAENFASILYRCFWMIQYYIVYYEREVCTISPMEKPLSHASSQFIEFFPLKDRKSKNVLQALETYCCSYSSYFADNSLESLDLLALSRIIIDVIICQINLRKRIQVNSIIDASFYMDRRKYSNVG